MFRKTQHVLGDISTEVFLRDYWQKKPLLIRQALPGFQSPLDADELAGLACEESVESRLIQKTGRRWSLQNGPFNARTFAKLPKRDWTLLVQDVEKHLPELADYLDLFNFIPQWRIDDLMISVAAAGGGVGPHTDAYDVFLLQAHGRRRWSVAERYDPALIDGMDLRVLQNFQAEQEWILEPGDMLYLPPNVAHDGVAVDDNCMTWSIGFRAPSMQDMLTDFTEWLYQRVPQNAMYTDADLDSSEADDGTISARGFQRARALLRQAMQPGDDVIDRWFGQFVTEPKPWLRCEASADMTADLLRRRLEAGESLQRDSRARLAWAKTANGAVLFVDGEAWDLPSRQGPLIGLICRSRHLPGEEIGDSLDADGVALLLRLHQHGAVHFESADEDAADAGT